MICHSKDQKVTFNCDICDVELSNRSHLKDHVKNVHKKSEYTCQLCEKIQKIFSCKKPLKRHVLEFHDGTKYECTICNIKLKTRDALKVHENAVHLDIVQRYEC